MFICPVCGEKLLIGQKTASCSVGHSFDMAKEGYVNLLLGSKSGEHMGDDKAASRSRRDFLNKGYYAPLRDALLDIFASKVGNVLDICCGEGYYTSALGENKNLRVYGFDISKEMIRLAAKRGGAAYFVANMTSIPLKNGAADYCIHLFAPFCEGEFTRVLKEGGSFYTVIPGSGHLFGLKEALYDNPYLNDEKLPATQIFKLKEKINVKSKIILASNEDIEAVFRMTPYFFRTSEKDKQKLKALDSLETDIEFIIAEYKK